MTLKAPRVRFAPSPTGPLHLGGVRTALFNHLLARKHNGTMILRIEDTDQNRYVEGAEQYIIDALEWTGIQIDEGPHIGGEYGPYRQSERGDIYLKYANILLENGWAYMAFDSPQELDKKREDAKSMGNHSWQYDSTSRESMKNSLTLSDNQVRELIDQDVPYVIRFKIPKDETISFNDIIRGDVSYDTNLLDDKVLFKTDGFPTYHMANVIDDHLMKITHVIRGEEWLPSTPLHVLLYKAFGWQNSMPKFAHLPLILKPQGQGKLSKRDGAKYGFPVFPLNWFDVQSNEQWIGYKETGFIPEGFQNMLAFLGWNAGTEQEVFSPKELIDIFSLDRVNKSGARFDYEKAKWFNQQHLKSSSIDDLLILAIPYFKKEGIQLTDDQLSQVIELFKERVSFMSELPVVSSYLFDSVTDLDKKMVKKKWKPESASLFMQLSSQLSNLESWTPIMIESTVKSFMEDNELGFGQVLPILRLAICGTMKGPSIFDVMAFLSKQEVVKRLTESLELFTTIKTAE